MGWTGLLDGLTGLTRDTFGESVTYRRARTGGETQIRAVFDPDHVYAGVDGQVQVSTVQPVLDVRLADLSAAPEQGDEVTIRGRRYSVVEVQPGGDDCATLLLHRK